MATIFNDVSVLSKSHKISLYFEQDFNKDVQIQ